MTGPIPLCPECGGAGITTEGETCPVCDGFGSLADAPEPEPEDPDDA